jgi:hypothetical protein
MHDHVSIQMASGAGIDLAHRNPGGGNASGVVIGLLIPFNDGTAEFAGQIPERAFQQGCFAGAWRTDQIQNKNTLFFEQGTVETGKSVVFAKDIFFDRNFRSLSGF